MPKLELETTPSREGRGNNGRNDEADDDIPAFSEFNTNLNIIRWRPDLRFRNVPEHRAGATGEMALNGSESFRRVYGMDGAAAASAVQGTFEFVTNLTVYSAQHFSVAARTRSAEIPSAPALTRNVVTPSAPAPTPNVVTPSTMTPSAPALTPSSETFSAATPSTVTPSAEIPSTPALTPSSETFSAATPNVVTPGTVPPSAAACNVVTPSTVPPSAAACNVVTPSTLPPSAAACSVVTPGSAAPNSCPSSQHGFTTFPSTGAPAANTLSPAADTVGGRPREAPSPRQQQQQGLVTRPPGRRPVSLPQILVDPPSPSSAGLPHVPDHAVGQWIPPHHQSLCLPALESTEDDDEAVLPEAGGLGEALRPPPPRSSFMSLVRALPHRRHVSIEVLFD